MQSSVSKEYILDPAKRICKILEFKTSKLFNTYYMRCERVCDGYRDVYRSDEIELLYEEEIAWHLLQQ